MLAALVEGQFDLIACAPLLDELAEVLARTRLVHRYGVTAEDIAELVDLLRERAVMVPLSANVRSCRDPDDDVVLETEMTGNADTAVSRDEDLKGNRDLVTLLTATGIEVMSVRRFL